MAAPKLANLMSLIFSLISLFLLLLSSSELHTADGATPTPTNIISGTCGKTPDYNLCVSIINADRRGPKAGDVKTLGLIMIDAISDRGTTALNEINRLMKTAPSLKDPLNKCAIIYNDLVEDTIPSATQSVAFGAPKYAQEEMNDLTNECKSCEEAFSSRGKKSPLSKYNNDVSRVAAVAAAVITLLL